MEGSTRNRATKTAKYTFLLIYAAAIIVPILYIIMSSFKTNEDLFNNPWSLPDKWQFRAYYDVFIKYKLYKFFLNSLYYASFAVVLNVVICLMASYALVRMKWKLRSATFGFFLLGIMVPIHSMVVPLYIFSARIGISNPRITLIVIFVAFAIPLSILIFSGYLKSVPRELEEAAIIDGSSILGAFWRVVVPVMQPAIATVSIFKFLTTWNDFFIGFIFITNQKHWTIQLGISQFRGNFSVRYSHLLAAIIIGILPTMITYIVLNKKIIAGLTAGAVKY
jgi:raffinose/stachyose/melibiose transport system permease protein